VTRESEAAEVARQLESGGWLALEFEVYEQQQFAAWLAETDAQKAEGLRLQAKAVNLFLKTVKAHAKRTAATAAND
jgi:hypothetical protein